ncbi:MAG: citrate lyase acyl carrier protein [Clostridiaceae bacterium]|nr:citrate lyase acyl carrier protein [Clostridiaceae bacterium]
MKLLKAAAAGTVESGDIQIAVEPIEGKAVEIELKSTVMGLYGKQIRKVIEETVKECGADGVRVAADDKGALDCTVRARVRTALLRASESQDYGWTTK